MCQHQIDSTYRLNKFLTIAADVMFVSGMTLLLLIRKIQFTIAEYLPRRTARQLSNSLRTIMFPYARGEFLVHYSLLDMEFEKMKKTRASCRSYYRSRGETCGPD